TTPPVLTCPSNITVEATNASGNIVNFSSPAATDNVSTPTIVTSVSNGSRFALGTTTVNVTATDAANNQSSCSFTVTVRDTTAPDLTVPTDITVEAASGAGTIVTFSPTATDAVSFVTIVANPPSGSLFPQGITTVHIT